MLLTGGDNVVVRGLLLQNQPHAFHIVPGIAPVPEGIHIAKLQMVLQALGNASGSQRDLSGDEVLAPALRLVVEENAVHGKHTIGLPVLLNHPETVLLGNGIGGIGVERCGLPLRDLLHLAEKLGGRCLINAAGTGKSADADRLQNPQNAQGIHIAGIFGHVKADLHMGLGRQIVDFIRLYLTDDANQAGGIGQVPVMEFDLPHKVVNAGSIGNGRPAGDAMDFVALFQKEFGKIGAVLAGNAGDQCFFHCDKPLSDIFALL